MELPSMSIGDAKEGEVEMLDGATPEQMHKRAHFTKPDSDTVTYPQQSPILRPGFPGVSESVQDHMPHAPPPPPPPQPAIHIIQPPGYGHVPSPHSFSTSSEPSISYAGYTFTNDPAEHMGQQETWAIANKERMPASQADLKSQVDKNLKRGITGLDQYLASKMTVFKRRQIDELIRECIRMDEDGRFEYVIASIKSDMRRRKSGPSTMQVILKRQPRTGIIMRGPVMEFSSISLPSSGLVDVSYHYNWTADPYSLSSGSNRVRH
ncbi:hypothetical protein BDR22DRAFT_964184 [Usnea florida]